MLLIGVFGQGSSGAGTPNPSSPSATESPPTTTGSSPTTPPPATSTTVVTSTPGRLQQTSPVASTGTSSPASAEIQVLNSTDVSGLAARMSDFLGARGWQVLAPGNFAATLANTTIYYPPGYEPAARALAPLIPGDDADQVIAAPDTLPANVVTVVIGADAAGWKPPS